MFLGLALEREVGLARIGGRGVGGEARVICIGCIGCIEEAGGALEVDVAEECVEVRVEVRARRCDRCDVSHACDVCVLYTGAERVETLDACAAYVAVCCVLLTRGVCFDKLV